MNILIVDDNIVNLAVIGGMVSKVEGCVYKSISSPVDALAYCEDGTNEIDLLLVDYMMPDINGIEFIRRFKEIELRSGVPVIMITADTEKSVRYEALQNGANDFLNKPIDGAELIARVKNMLLIRQSQLELSSRAQWLKSEVEKATVTILEREREAIMRLSRAAEYRDPETGMHIFRMSAYSEHIAKNLGLSKDECRPILEAAPMHDIGKVGIADHILLKPGKLDDAEFEIMKTHSQIGYDILKDSYSPLLQVASKIALFHHEKWDGSGYPAGLKGEDIDLYSRIVAVADVFDALTSERPYKKAWELERATNFLQENSGSHFDPICVEAMLKNWTNVLYIMAKYKESH